MRERKNPPRPSQFTTGGTTGDVNEAKRTTRRSRPRSSLVRRRPPSWDAPRTWRALGCPLRDGDGPADVTRTARAALEGYRLRAGSLGTFCETAQLAADLAAEIVRLSRGAVRPSVAPLGQGLHAVALEEAERCAT